MKAPFLIGSKVYLRPLEKEDAPLLVGWLNDPEVRRWLRARHPISLAAEEEHLEAIRKDRSAVVSGIAARDGDRLLGAVGLHDIDPINRHTWFGILIGSPADWGKGYGTEATRLIVEYAFATLNLNRVWLHVHADNARGLRAYEKAGFRREGVLRQEHYRDGRYGDTVVMAVLRSEWEEQRRGGGEPG